MTIPKIPADGFMIYNGPFGFSLCAQQIEYPVYTEQNKVEVRANTVVEIRVSPIVAKNLLQSLAQNVEMYEGKFGEIKMPTMPALGRAN